MVKIQQRERTMEILSDLYSSLSRARSLSEEYNETRLGSDPDLDVACLIDDVAERVIDVFVVKFPNENIERD